MGLAVLFSFAADADAYLVVRAWLADSLQSSLLDADALVLKDISRMKATWNFLREKADVSQPTLLGASLQ